jgi:long-chain acyl-CoA synthetase
LILTSPVSLINSLLRGGGQLEDAAHSRFCNSDLVRLVGKTACELRKLFPAGNVIALLLPNCPAWVIADLAIQSAGMICIPIPNFFTETQISQTFKSGKVAGFIHSLEQGNWSFAKNAVQPSFNLEEFGIQISVFQKPGTTSIKSSKHVGKLTFTSGSTGAPKGVMVSLIDQYDVAETLSTALARLRIKRHLSMLPLPILLENIAGVYTALRSGAEVMVPDLSRVGLTGSSQFDPELAIEFINAHSVESMIILPQMLFALVTSLSRTRRSLTSLKFVAVGGAHTPTALIVRARALGIPVYEGYGLSEAGSVVCLNLPGQDCHGSVGRPLAHRRIKTAQDGELLFSNVRGGPWIKTGDLGSIDAEGFVSVNGRKKNLLITGYGRNVSPEWPETILLGTGVFAQVMVYGETAAYLSALVFPVDAKLSESEISAAVAKANAQLPDYARIGDWHRLTQPLSSASGLVTANGRIRRDLVIQRLLGRSLPRHSPISLEDVLS